MPGNKYKPAVLIFQLVYHPFDESLQSVRFQDFRGLRVDIFQAIFNSWQGSVVIPGTEYLKQGVPDAASEKYKIQHDAQIEKSLYAAKLCIENNYDFILYCADDVICDKSALQLLLAEKKDFITALTYFKRFNYDTGKFIERISDPDGKQDSDDRPVEIHKDFKIGDVIPITRGVSVFCLISRRIIEHKNFKGFNEKTIYQWLQENNFIPFLHTGVGVKYLGDP